MHLISAPDSRTANIGDDLETLNLSEVHVSFLKETVRELCPDMPAAFGVPHLIRAILDRVEQAGVELTDASSEDDITRLVTTRLRQTRMATSASR